jgi:L-ascorbate metabolism protein UlaG (beta-lactamase superfamily)
MELTWLGWAGIELEHDGATAVVDPLHDAGAVFAPLGEEAARGPVPQITAPQPGRAVAGLVTHLHRDHTDAQALKQALQPGAAVLEPPAGGGDTTENLALLQAEHELTEAGLPREQLTTWQTTTKGPFTITALPAVDGFGDPQHAWLVEAGGVKVLHLGDTLFHGFWWRMVLRHGPFDVVCLPVNAARTWFPHRKPASPLPAVLTPETAAIAAELLQAKLAIPIHAEGYDVAGLYEPVSGAATAFAAEAEKRGVPVRVLEVGESLTL